MQGVGDLGSTDLGPLISGYAFSIEGAITRIQFYYYSIDR